MKTGNISMLVTMLQDSNLQEGALWLFILALAAFLAFGFVSCQDKGSGPLGEDWQAMYEALSEAEQAKLGDGLKSVATSGLSKETIVGSAFDSTYAMDANGEQVLFFIIMQVDTTGTIDELEKLGLSPELDDENWNTYWAQATFGQITTLAGIGDILHIEAETEWHRLWRGLSQEERAKPSATIIQAFSYLYENLYTTNEPSAPSIKYVTFSEREAVFRIHVIVPRNFGGLDETGEWGIETPWAIGPVTVGLQIVAHVLLALRLLDLQEVIALPRIGSVMSISLGPYIPVGIEYH